MNSVIQCLSNTKLLLEYLRKDAYSDDINVTISSMKGALIKGRFCGYRGIELILIFTF